MSAALKSTTPPQPEFQREIVYDRESHDYALYIDGQIIGFARTYHEGEVILDTYVAECLAHGQRESEERSRTITVRSWAEARTALDGVTQGAARTLGTGDNYPCPFAVFYAEYGPNGYEVWGTKNGMLDRLVVSILIIAA
jgi:hypothetical protein